MTILTMAIKDTVKIDISVVKLLNDEKIVLVDPVRIARLKSLD